ncbi:sensor histidine kinase [Halalkalibacter flavus]|uniref:sensor histidine kinase n=1 Tax=Halalkalibacter flavus TaxID=3090668 RepID=UPI002FC5EA13
MWKRIKFNLLLKMILLMSFVLISCLIVTLFLFTSIFNEAMNKHFGERAMDVAILVAKNDQIIDAFEFENPSAVIQPIAETIRELTGASYVVVGNTEDIRYSHHDQDQIGQEMGTSNEDVFVHEQSVIYEGVGVSGAATKAKTPIYNRDGQLIGVSSIGFLYEDIKNELNNYVTLASQFFIGVLILAIIGMILVARKLKKMFFGLEPEEISYLFKEKEAILESIHDPIIATNSTGHIVSINKKARNIPYFRNINIGDSIKHPQLINELNSVNKEKEITNREIIIDHSVYVMDHSPFLHNDTLLGVVFTLRPVSEIRQLKEDFSKIKVFTENMRSQNHEFLNKLNTIYGLLKLDKTNDAIQLISKEVEYRQDFLAFLIESVRNPMIAACLLGKANRATERKVQLEIENESELSPLPDTFDEQTLVTIIANVIENAIEAAYKAHYSEGKVNISFTDLGPDIIFDIEDNGKGILPEEEWKIFEEGYTSKETPKNHGLGLAIVKNSLEKLNGNIFITESQLGGARFTITIPKQVI